MKKVLSVVRNATEKTVDGISVVLFCIIFCLGLMQIVSRWVFHHPLSWTEESINLIYVWICYLGWIIAERKGSHIRITFLVGKLRDRKSTRLNSSH